MELGKEIVIEAKVVVSGMAPLKKISDFFAKEYANGAREFRIKIEGEGIGYIHPIGKDGETCDFDLTEYLQGGEDEINLETSDT